MNIHYETGLHKCKCGGKARYRYRMPLHWVECRNKRCDVRTHYYPDVSEQNDINSRELAFKEWEEMASK